MAERGRPKAIESPELLWEHFCNYKQWAKGNPIKVQDFVGKDGQEVYRLRERPLTIEGFENYCFEHRIINDLSDYFSNKEDRYTDFAAICLRIRKTVRQDQIEGGMAGIYNPSITQRLNSLVEKQQTDMKVQGATITYIQSDGNEPIKDN